MDNILVSVHSVVDIITNSSTTIYTGATDGAVELVTTIINETLRQAGSDKRADDLYEIKVVKEPDDDTDDWEEYGSLRREFAKNASGKVLELGEIYGCGDISVTAESYLSITPKGSDGNDLAYLFSKIFFVEERYE